MHIALPSIVVFVYHPLKYLFPQDSYKEVKKMIPYFLKPHNSVDIDNHDDLHLARILFRNK